MEKTMAPTRNGFSKHCIYKNQRHPMRYVNWFRHRHRRPELHETFQNADGTRIEAHPDKKQSFNVESKQLEPRNPNNYLVNV